MSIARRLQRTQVVDTSPPLAIVHGEDLRSPLESGTNVSPAVLLGSNWQSRLVAPPPIIGEGTYRVSALQWGQWPAVGFPDSPYVYNNDPTNHGGWVPAGGMVIDGYHVPEGTYVVQFMDLPHDFYITDASFGFLLRGCRFRRGNISAPGLLNFSDLYKGRFIGIHYCDIGGIGPEDNVRFEVGLKIQGSITNGSHVRLLGNYISYHNTAIQFPDAGGVRSFELIENYCEKPNYNYDTSGPKGDGDDVHLNGVWISGGQTHCLMTRNKIIMQHPDELGRPVQQTDCMIFFQRSGQNLGTGQNHDGTQGYQIRDNYMGGGGWTIYAGLQDGNAPETAQNFTYTGNKITTQWWPNGGYFGPVADQPVWGQYGNVKSNNTWADGPNSGNTW